MKPKKIFRKISVKWLYINFYNSKILKIAKHGIIISLTIYP